MDEGCQSDGGCGAAAFKAANAKDANKLGDIGGDILDTCEACHHKYKPQ